MADLGGVPLACSPPTAQNFLNFMQFFGKFDKIVCWHPLEGRRPLLQGILDPPLITLSNLVFMVLEKTVLNSYLCLHVPSMFGLSVRNTTILLTCRTKCHL